MEILGEFHGELLVGRPERPDERQNRIRRLNAVQCAEGHKAFRFARTPCKLTNILMLKSYSN